MIIGCGVYGYSLNRIGTIFSEISEAEHKLMEEIYVINKYMD